MAENDLRNLHRLHLVDAAIVEIRKMAANLDPGRQIAAEINALTKAIEEKTEVSKRLHGEQADLELEQKAIDAKIKKIDGELYGGKVVNPREVENLQKEVEILKRRRGELDDKIFVLMEQVPADAVNTKPLEEKLAQKKAELLQHQAKVRAQQAKLEEAFRTKSAQRPELAKAVSPALLAKYDAIRKKLDGVGMTDVARNGSCESCGTMLATKIIEGAKEGRVVNCDTCHRIVYASEGLV